MKSSVIFIPFYGTVPPYISAFLHTVAFQKDFMDVYFISDNSFLTDLRKHVIPENVIMIEMSWEELCCLIEGRTKLRKPFYPYKLCDYKPAYGHVFEEYTKGYEYWGYMDIDVLVGDVKGFLERNHYRQYDRIGVYGHFTLYRNTEEFRLFYKREYPGQSYFSKLKNACKTTYPCNIDEIGTNELFLRMYEKEHFLQNNFVLNTCYESIGCHTYKGRNLPQLLTWEKGHVYSYIQKSEGIEKEEGMYIHFMKEKNLQTGTKFDDAFIITPDCLVPFDTDKIQDYFNSVGKVDTPEERKSFKAKFNKHLRRDRADKFIREFRTNGIFSAMLVLLSRLHGIHDLYKHKLL